MLYLRGISASACRALDDSASHDRSATLICAKDTAYATKHVVWELLVHNRRYLDLIPPAQRVREHRLCCIYVELSVA